MNTKIGIFFRTHIWDDFVAEQASAMRERTHGGDFRILADETRTRFSTPGFVKFSHQDEDFEPLGLYRYFDTGLLWYNADYPLYLISRTFADLDYILMIEYDVFTNVDLSALAQDCARDGIDVLCHNMHPAEPEWPWLNSCSEIYAETWRGLVPVLLVSRLAVEYLFSRRRLLSEQFRQKQLSRLPFCEGFIPSEVRQSGFLRVRELSHYGDTSKFEFWPPVLADGQTRVQAGSFIHPYLNEPRFIPSRLRYEARPVDDYLDPSSQLHADLKACSSEKVLHALIEFVGKQGDFAALHRLRTKAGL